MTSFIAEARFLGESVESVSELSRLSSSLDTFQKSLVLVGISSGNEWIVMLFFAEQSAMLLE